LGFRVASRKAFSFLSGAQTTLAPEQNQQYHYQINDFGSLLLASDWFLIFVY
jgi:hypothetical protein